MLMDMYFTKLEVMKRKKSYKYPKNVWRFQGVAKDLKHQRKNYVFFRTNSMTQYIKLKKDRRYKIVEIF